LPPGDLFAEQDPESALVAFRSVGGPAGGLALPPHLIDIDQLAIVLLPLNLGKVGMRDSTQLAKPPF